MASKGGNSTQVAAAVISLERPLLAQRRSLRPPSSLLRALLYPSIGLDITLPKGGCAGAGTRVVCLCMRGTSNQQCPTPPWHSITSTTHFLLSPARRLTRLTSLPTSPPRSLSHHLKTRGRGTPVQEASLAQLRLAQLHSPPSTRPRAMEQHLQELPWVVNGIRVLEGFLLLPFTIDLSHGVRRMEITR